MHDLDGKGIGRPARHHLFFGCKVFSLGRSDCCVARMCRDLAEILVSVVNRRLGENALQAELKKKNQFYSKIKAIKKKKIKLLQSFINLCDSMLFLNYANF